MKQKLTLSIERSKVALLRRASARRSRSISELVEEFAQQQEKAPTEGEPNILKWKGFWHKHVTDAAFEADDRAGAQLRKTEAYQRRKAKPKRA